MCCWLLVSDLGPIDFYSPLFRRTNRLDPAIARRIPWTEQEDAVLIDAHARFGANFEEIARPVTRTFRVLLPAAEQGFSTMHTAILIPRVRSYRFLFNSRR